MNWSIPASLLKGIPCYSGARRCKTEVARHHVRPWWGPPDPSFQAPTATSLHQLGTRSPCHQKPNYFHLCVMWRAVVIFYKTHVWGWESNVAADMAATTDCIGLMWAVSKLQGNREQLGCSLDPDDACAAQSFGRKLLILYKYVHPTKPWQYSAHGEVLNMLIMRHFMAHRLTTLHCPRFRLLFIWFSDKQT